MSGPERSPSTESEHSSLSYDRGDAVRVYREGTEAPEDDWEYRLYREEDDHEIAAKHSLEGGHTELAATPKAEFDRWQRERIAAEDAGRLLVEKATEDTEKLATERTRLREMDDDPLDSYLKSIGAPEETIREVKKLLREDHKELVKSLVDGLGVDPAHLDHVAELLSWSDVRLRIEKLVELGLPNDKPTRDSMHELIMTNRETIKLPVIYSRLEELGLIKMHPGTADERAKYKAATEAITKDSKDLLKGLLEKELISADWPDDSEEKKESKKLIENLLKIPTQEFRELVSLRLKSLGFNDQQIDRIFKPNRLNDKFVGLRRSHFGGWTEDGKYNFVYDPARIAERTHIPLEILLAAAEQGISPEYLNLARNNETAGTYLRSLGIDWGGEFTAPTDDAESEFLDITDEGLAEASRISGREITRSYVELAKNEYRLGNLFPAEYLATLGIPIINEGMEPPDPITLANKVGRDRAQAVAKIAGQIEDDPAGVSSSLKRPASLPLPKLFYGSVLRTVLTDPLNSAYAPVGKRLLAWRVARREIKHRPAEIAKLTKELKDLKDLEEPTATQKAEITELTKRIPRLQARQKAGLGLLRIGLPTYREAHDYVDNLDESVGSHRRQLSIFQRNKLHDINTAIINLAYRVFDTQTSLEILTKQHLLNDYDDPMSIHNHERFKAMRSAYVEAYIKQGQASKGSR